MIPRGLEFALLLTALVWVCGAYATATRAASGITTRFQLGGAQGLLESVFLLFLIVVGFRALDWIATRGRAADDVLRLPTRKGWPQEWLVGAAIGWGLCLATVLPVLLSGHLHADMNWGRGSAMGMLFALASLLVSVLAEETVFRGYPFQRLIRIMGPSWAAVLGSVGFAAVLVFANPPQHLGLALVDGTLFGLVLAMAYLRTHALWLGWGLHFAYRAVAAVVLGLPIAGHGEFGSLTSASVSGPRWLTGGAFGLDAALLTGLLMLGAMAVLYRATREYAWQYTHREIVAAGYEVVVAPPAAHVAMEKAAAPAPLVQILSTTPQTRSVLEPYRDESSRG